MGGFNYDVWAQRQRKKAQGETNERLEELTELMARVADGLERLVAEQARTNELLASGQGRTNQLLEWLGGLLPPKAIWTSAAHQEGPAGAVTT